MKPAPEQNAKKILAIDVGGTHVKALVTGQREPRKIPSGPKMTAREWCDK
jgi:hexokinase